jgi:hypothetical protein
VPTGDVYTKAVSLWERKREGAARNGFVGEGFSADLVRWSSPTCLFPQRGESSPLKTKSKCFSGFEFYMFAPSQASLPPTSPLSNSPPTSQSQIGSDVIVDPTKGFHPLISMYFLAREKMEPERVYGPASSQLQATMVHNHSSLLLHPRRGTGTWNTHLLMTRLITAWLCPGYPPRRRPITQGCHMMPKEMHLLLRQHLLRLAFLSQGRELAVPKRADVSRGAPNTPAKPDAATSKKP